jgi:hypothetical protein
VFAPTARPNGRAHRKTRWLLAVFVAVSVASSMPARAQVAIAGGILESTIGPVIVTRGDGTTEQVGAGARIDAGDRVATAGAGGATIRFDDGSQLALMSDTTVDVRRVERGASGGLILVADQSRGVSTARTSGREAEIRITSGSEGTVALLRQGGMAFGTDVGTGDVSAACEDRGTQLFFPYEDLRVPCEQNVVRTRTSRGDVQDAPAGDQPPVSSVVSPPVVGRPLGTVPEGQLTTSRGDRDERERDPGTFQPLPSTCLPPRIAPNIINLELSWGAPPRDLDAHLSGPSAPNSSDRFHAFVFDPGPVSHARLECDNQEGTSIERIAILPGAGTGQNVPGDYRFWVHNFSGQQVQDARFCTANARVTITQNGVQVGSTFNVREASGACTLSLWHVVNFTLDSSGRITTLTPVQQFKSATAGPFTVLGRRDDDKGDERPGNRQK